MLGKNFSKKPLSYVADHPRLVTETPDGALNLTKHCSQTGRYLWMAEIPTRGGDRRRTAVVDVRRTEGEKFQASLSEIMRQPYVFGIGLTDHGCESGWGSDCSNMLVSAWRRNGVRMKWGDPAMVEAQLQEHDSRQLLSREAMADGLAISFGNHMAALWEDKDPLGIVGPEDTVIHHLGGAPEIISLATLAKKKGTYKVFRLPEEKYVTLGFIGDVVIKQTEQSDMKKLATELTGFDATFGNLEGMPSDKDGVSELDLRFGPVSLQQFQTFIGSRITAMSIANNHAADGGITMPDSKQRLRNAKFVIFGDTVKPFHWEKNGVRVAVFGICVVPTKADVAQWNKHSQALLDAIQQERRQGRHCVVLTHWGREYHSSPDEEQRSIAKVLLQSGAAAVIGAHPHMDQPQDWHHGGMVVYSLGNALYPPKWKAQDNGSVLHLRLFQSGRIKFIKRSPLQ